MLLLLELCYFWVQTGQRVDRFKGRSVLGVVELQQCGHWSLRR